MRARLQGVKRAASTSVRLVVCIGVAPLLAACGGTPTSPAPTDTYSSSSRIQPESGQVPAVHPTDERFFLQRGLSDMFEIVVVPKTTFAGDAASFAELRDLNRRGYQLAVHAEVLYDLLSVRTMYAFTVSVEKSGPFPIHFNIRADMHPFTRPGWTSRPFNTTASSRS